MPIIVGILIFISMINTTSERLKAKKFYICRYFSFYEQLQFLSWVEHEKSFITSGQVILHARLPSANIFLFNFFTKHFQVYHQCQSLDPDKA